MSELLKDKVIIVTGGAGLLGKAFVESIIQHGGIAVIADFNEMAALAVKAELNSSRVECVGMDITDKDSIISVIKAIDKKHGRIDALINNAYPRTKNYGQIFEDVPYEDFCQNMNMNLGGYFITSQQFIKYFKSKGVGNIINIASIYGVIAPKFDVYDETAMTMPVEYAVIKSGLIHLTKYLAKYLKGQNIRVNALSPGGIEAGQQAEFLSAYNKKCLNKGMLCQDDLTGSLVYLLSDLSTYMNGQNLIIDDGFTL